VSFLRIAHRGASGTRPEHTRAAFERALEIGVDMIELDIQCTRDGELVVLHDRELGRTVTGHGPVRDCCLAELSALDAGAWFGDAYRGERVMSLQEVLALTAGRAGLNIEIKSPEPDWAATARRLAQLLEDHQTMASHIISCFDVGALDCVREAMPAARLGLLWDKAALDEAWGCARDLGAGSIHLRWGAVDECSIVRARQDGLAVIAWTVNDPVIMQRLVDQGLGGIITDYPEHFATIRG